MSTRSDCFCPRLSILWLWVPDKNVWWPSPSWSGPEPGKGCQVLLADSKATLRRYLILSSLLLVPLYGMNWWWRILLQSCLEICFHECIRLRDASLAVRKLDDWRSFLADSSKLLCLIPTVGCFSETCPKTRVSMTLTHVSQILDWMTDVHIFPDPANDSKNRGYCFVDFESHQSASYARKQLWLQSSKFLEWPSLPTSLTLSIEADGRSHERSQDSLCQGTSKRSDSDRLVSNLLRVWDVAQSDKYRDDSAKIYTSNTGECY